MSKDSCSEIVRARNRGYLVYGETLAATLACDGNKIFDKDWKKAATYVMSPVISTDITTQDHILNHLQSG